MSFSATVLRVLIASPTDVLLARDAVENAIHSWNRNHAMTKKVVLLPWRWETDSVPILGDHPQAIINQQGVDEADIVIAIFGSRLGSPTPNAESGTTEEILRAAKSRKPVHVYFSNESVRINEIDPDQVSRLSIFKKQMQELGLLGEFSTTNELTEQVWRAIEYDVNKLNHGEVAKQNETLGVRFRIESKKEPDKNWIEITNTGDTTAESVTFEGSASTGLMHIVADDEPITLEPGNPWKVPAIYSWDTSVPKLTIRWVEKNEQHSKTFNV